MRFINDRVHGVIDYILAITLVVAPFVLGFDGTSKYLSVAVIVIVVLLTNPKTS